eukprot:scaffold7020_cov430-Prasinococcus_capsulatus_cf.AAC.4
MPRRPSCQDLPSYVAPPLIPRRRDTGMAASRRSSVRPQPHRSQPHLKAPPTDWPRPIIGRARFLTRRVPRGRSLEPNSCWKPRRPTSAVVARLGHAGRRRLTAALVGQLSLHWRAAKARSSPAPRPRASHVPRPDRRGGRGGGIHGGVWGGLRGPSPPDDSHFGPSLENTRIGIGPLAREARPAPRQRPPEAAPRLARLRAVPAGAAPHHAAEGRQRLPRPQEPPAARAPLAPASSSIITTTSVALAAAAVLSQPQAPLAPSASSSVCSTTLEAGKEGQAVRTSCKKTLPVAPSTPT